MWSAVCTQLLGMPVRWYCIAVVVLFDSPGYSSQRHVAAALPAFVCSRDRATLLDSFRNDLASSQFKQVYGFDPASEPLLSVPQLEHAGIQSDLPSVAEERSDDEMRAAFAREVEECGEENVAGRAYGCDHCHCSVCKRSLEQHDCQRSSSGSEHEVMSDDAGGSVPQSLHRSVCCVHFGGNLC